MLGHGRAPFALEVPQTLLMVQAIVVALALVKGFGCVHELGRAAHPWQEFKQC